jgi:arsenate reductase (thioredoxin)
MKEGEHMPKQRVLFVCVHNSARSQMAEAFLNHFGGDRFSAESAGLEPGQLNPIVVLAMQEVGIKLAGKSTQDVFDFVKEGRQYDFVITVCDETAGERCPVFPGHAARLHWNFEDPSGFRGTQVERLTKTRIVRDQIRQRIDLFLKEVR